MQCDKLTLSLAETVYFCHDAPVRPFDRIQSDNIDDKRRQRREAVMTFQRFTPSNDEADTVMELRATYTYDFKSSRLGPLRSVTLSSTSLTPTEIARFPWSRWLKLTELHALAGTSVLSVDASMFELSGREPADTASGRKAKAATDRAVRTQAGERSRPGRKGWEPGFYEEVARRWGELRLLADPHPASTIATERGYSINTVNGWLKVCRARNLMPKSTRGRFAQGGTTS